MAELGQHPAAEPAKQRARLLVEGGSTRRIFGHYRLHRGPVRHGRADIGQRYLHGFEQFAALAGVNPRGFDIDQRFARAFGGLGARLLDRGDRASGIARDGRNGVQ